jgi:hypothetical protein
VGQQPQRQQRAWRLLGHMLATPLRPDPLDRDQRSGLYCVMLAAGWRSAAALAVRPIPASTSSPLWNDDRGIPGRQPCEDSPPGARMWAFALQRPRHPSKALLPRLSGKLPILACCRSRADLSASQRPLYVTVRFFARDRAKRFHDSERSTVRIRDLGPEASYKAMSAHTPKESRRHGNDNPEIGPGRHLPDGKASPASFELPICRLSWT